MSLPQRPVRLKAAPRSKGTKRVTSPKKKATTPTKQASSASPLETSTALLWISLAAAAVFIAGAAVWISWSPNSFLNPKPTAIAAPAPPIPPTPQVITVPIKTPTPEEKRLAEIQQRVAAEIKQQREADQQRAEQEKARWVQTEAEAAAAEQALAQAQAAPPVPPAPATPPPTVAVVKTMPTPASAPPQPVPVVNNPVVTVPNAPARALPLDPNKLDTERIAAYQVALERIHFSCGFIDGDTGMRTQRMLRAYQSSRGLPITGQLDAATRASIGEPGEPFLTYTVTAEDIASIMPKPSGWRAKSEVSRLGYNDMWEMLGEKFHCTRAYLRQLNPTISSFSPGQAVIGPKVYPAAPLPKVASIRINLGETSLEGLDNTGRIISFFPCSIAADKNKRPNGTLTVKSVVPNPDYTFDPALFKDAAVAEGINHKITLPPGPRNPVGTAWIGLSLPGYGMHGTPEPENISRTQSHGCFRLANWNAEKLLKMVKVGTLVDVEP